MEVPQGLAGMEAWPVTGSDPRVWNRPLAFGPWRTASVQERSTRSWAVQAFGLGAGATVRPYLLVLVGEDGREREIACMNRAVELWRGSFTVDLTGIAYPRLACAIPSPLTAGGIREAEIPRRAGRAPGAVASRPPLSRPR